MYQLYLKYKDREFIYFIPLAMLCGALRMQQFFRRLLSSQGFPQSADSQWYLEYARSLIANFKIELHMNDILYFGYNILLTLLLAIFKDPLIVIFIQAGVAGLSVILVYKIACMVFNRTTAIIASLFYTYSWDLTLWSMYILSDSFFISLLLLNVYLLLKSFEANKRIYFILFVVTSLYMLIFRPTGIPSLFFIMIYFVIRPHSNTLIINYVKKHKFVIVGVSSAAVAACVFLYIGHKLDPLITSLQFNAKMVLYNIYAKGWIYDNPTPHDYTFKPDYTINIMNSLILSFIINNWDHVLELYGKRVLAFIGRWVWDTDLRSLSGIQKFSRDALPAVLFLTGTIAAMVNGTFRKASIVWLPILAVFVFCILLFIDWMYRYKAPALPFIFIAAAYGADRIIRGPIIIAKKYMEKLLWDKKNR